MDATQARILANQHKAILDNETYETVKTWLEEDIDRAVRNGKLETKREFNPNYITFSVLEKLRTYFQSLGFVFGRTGQDGVTLVISWD